MSTELIARAAKGAPRRPRVVSYPEGDGKPMAETDPHVLQIAALLLTLRYWFRDAEQVYTAANMFIYHREGHPKRRIAPDIFVAWGVPKEPRRIYKLWVEKEAPQVIFEITSRKTREVDTGTKRAVYAQLGVSEYYLFDPFGQYLNPPLRGYQLIGEEYIARRVEALEPPACEVHEAASFPRGMAGWRLNSERLHLHLWALPTNESLRPYILRLYDPGAGKWLADPDQALVQLEYFEMQAREAEARAEHEVLARQEAEARAQREAEARKVAEERAERLQAELQRLRNKDVN